MVRETEESQKETEKTLLFGDCLLFVGERSE